MVLFVENQFELRQGLTVTSNDGGIACVFTSRKSPGMHGGTVLSVVGILEDKVDPMVSVMKVEKAPLESYADIGGLDAQIQEIKEAVELPLTHPELYEDIGIRPPKGVILYGVPGTGKTLLSKEDMAGVNVESKEYFDIVNKTFGSEDDRFQFYNSYALEKGFSVRRNYVEWDGASKKIIRRKLVCSHEGCREEKHLKRKREDRKRKTAQLTI
ncbi:hypothetical protein ACQ4PT_055407 [Festuca glaucescens]